jgi:hypothetical protein
MSKITQENCIFVINIYNSLDEIDLCLSNLRVAYPNSPIVIINDGDKLDYTAIADKYQTEYLSGRRWMLKPYGGKWTERYLNYVDVRHSNIEWIIAIHPDTVINKPILGEIPDNFNTFGSTPKSKTSLLFYGGLIGIKQSLAKRILQIGHLSSPLFCSCVYTFNYKGEKVSHQDLILSRVLKKMNESVYDHPEICINWRRTPPNPEEYSIYHPRVNR